MVTLWYIAACVTTINLILGLFVYITIQRMLELLLAEYNRVRALAAGGKEFGAGHYPLFFALHVGWLMGWVAEAIARGATLSQFWVVWLALFVAAQGLRYWCMISLGRFWNTRIVVIPGVKPVRRGPYRFMAHPIYLAVSLELASLPLIFGAWITVLVISILHAALLLGVRIPAEEKALRLME